MQVGFHERNHLTEQEKPEIFPGVKREEKGGKNKAKTTMKGGKKDIQRQNEAKYLISLRMKIGPWLPRGPLLTQT